MEHVMHPPEDVLEEGEFCCDEWLPYDETSVVALYHVGACEICKAACQEPKDGKNSGTA